MSTKNELIIYDNEKLTEFLLYKTSNGEIKIDVLLQNETIWLPQKKIAQLFEVDRSVITKHLQNIFKSGELDANSVSAKIAHTAEDGKVYQTKFYNLDAILSIGYRVNTTRATQFRIWATQVLKEFIIKGYTMDVERLKNPTPVFGKDYFDEQLEKIRDYETAKIYFKQFCMKRYRKATHPATIVAPLSRGEFASAESFTSTCGYFS